MLQSIKVLFEAFSKTIAAKQSTYRMWDRVINLLIKRCHPVTIKLITTRNMIFGKIYWVGILSTNLATVSGFYIKVKRWLQYLQLLNRCQLCNAEILHHYSLLPVSVIYSFLYLVATRVLQYNNTALMGFHTFLELQTCQQQHQDWCPVTKQKATIKSGDLWTHSGYQASLILRSEELSSHQNWMVIKPEWQHTSWSRAVHMVWLSKKVHLSSRRLSSHHFDTTYRFLNDCNYDHVLKSVPHEPS